MTVKFCNKKFSMKSYPRIETIKLGIIMKKRLALFASIALTAFIVNAQLYLEMQANGESFAEYLWSFVDHKTIVNNFSKDNWIATSQESDAMSKSLKKKGFKFVGSTICYAFMQAVGMVDDHMDYCWRRNQC